MIKKNILFNKKTRTCTIILFIATPDIKIVINIHN